MCKRLLRTVLFWELSFAMIGKSHRLYREVFYDWIGSRI
jgi:hypothetical protein